MALTPRPGTPGVRVGLHPLMRVIALLNRAAGAIAGEQSPPRVSRESVAAALRAAGVDSDVRLIAPEAMPLALADATLERPDAIVVGGGDGTLNTAAGVLAGGNVPLGLIPLGTLNHFAHDLGVPADLDGAIAVIACGHLRRVDVAEVNGRVFLNNCSLGAYPAAVRRRDALRRARGFGKWRAMFVASVDVFRRVRRLRATLRTEDGERLVRTPLLLVANNHYTGSLFSAALRPRLDGGKLWLYVARTHRFLPLLRSAWQALAHGLDAVDALDTQPATELTVALALPKITAGLDGELALFDGPLHFRIRPGALRVLAPAS